jgi:hypothetical protein
MSFHKSPSHPRLFNHCVQSLMINYPNTWHFISKLIGITGELDSMRAKPQRVKLVNHKLEKFPIVNITVVLQFNSFCGWQIESNLRHSLWNERGHNSSNNSPTLSSVRFMLVSQNYLSQTAESGSSNLQSDEELGVCK